MQSLGQFKPQTTSPLPVLGSFANGCLRWFRGKGDRFSKFLSYGIASLCLVKVKPFNQALPENYGLIEK
jgi:hypothetical protein